MIAVAFGGAIGATLRFLISTGVYQWLGRSFPYGTLTVNLIGSFLIGLMTEALILQRVELSAEYRAAILVGLFGSLTTFSTFSLDTLYLLQQGQLSKAGINVFSSVILCLLAVWLGFFFFKGLFSNGGTVLWGTTLVPYGLLTINIIGAFVIALLMTLLITHNTLSIEYNIGLTVVLVGVFMTFSSLYLLLHFIEQEQQISQHWQHIASILFIQLASCSAALWLGFYTAKNIG